MFFFSHKCYADNITTVPSYVIHQEAGTIAQNFDDALLACVFIDILAVQ